MSFRRPHFLFLILILVAIFAFAGCQKDGAGQGSSDLKVKSVSLSKSDMDYLLAKARADLFGSDKFSGTPSEIVTKKQASALFVSLTSLDRTADIAFAKGDSLANALERATKELKEKSANRDPATIFVRVDVVKSTGKTITVGKGRKPEFVMSIEGIYCKTSPPIPLHPLEIPSRGMFKEKELRKWVFEWQFNYSRLKYILKKRGLPKSLASQFNTKSGVKARTFTTISFVEGKDRKALELYRWSPKDIEITPDLLKERCVMAGEYLKSIVGPDGRFAYLVFPDQDKISKKYNMLRHCGTTYSMFLLYGLTHDEELLKKAKLAADFVVDQNLSGPRNRDKDEDFLCVRGEGKPGRTYDYCKLGGNGLLMTSLGTYTNVTGDTSYVPKMQELAKFVDFMQEPTGFFKSKYYFNDKYHKPFRSLFYPGEASLGLGLLHFLDGNMKWVEIGNKGINYLAKERAGTKPWKLPVDHWLIIAMNQLYRAQPNDENKEHAYDVAKGMIQTQMIDTAKMPQPDLFGGWGFRPQTSGNATRCEGLVAAYHMAKYAKDDAEPFFTCLEYASNMLVRFQFVEQGVAYFPEPKKVLGAFMDKIDTCKIQIDNVQHTMTALLGYREIMLQRQLAPADPATYNQWRVRK